MTMTTTTSPAPGRGRHRADDDPTPTVATAEESMFVLPPAVLAAAVRAAAEDEDEMRQVAEKIHRGDTSPRPQMTMRLGDTVISPSTAFEVPVLIEDVRPPTYPPPVRPYRPGVVFPATGAGNETLIGVEAETRRPMAVRKQGVWRLTMVGNFPSGSKKAKARLAKLPRRYQLVFGVANQLGVDSFGGNELGTVFWQVLEDRPGWRGRRGLANSAAGSNRIGNGCLWRHNAYRCLDSAHFTIPGLPSGEFDHLDMPVVLLEDREAGAIHAEVTIHNFARRYSKPWERDKVVAALIKLVDCLHDAGIPVILRGDFNDSVDVVDELEDHTDLVKVAPAGRSIDMIFVTQDVIAARRPVEVEKVGFPKLARVIDHGSITVVEVRVTPDDDTPRELPRFPRIAP